MCEIIFIVFVETLNTEIFPLFFFWLFNVHVDKEHQLAFRIFLWKILIFFNKLKSTWLHHNPTFTHCIKFFLRVTFLAALLTTLTPLEKSQLSNHYNFLGHKLKHRQNNQFEKVHSFITNVENDLCLWCFSSHNKFLLRTEKKTEKVSFKNFLLSNVVFIVCRMKTISMSSFLEWTVFLFSAWTSSIFYESQRMNREEGLEKVRFTHSHNWASHEWMNRMENSS